MAVPLSNTCQGDLICTEERSFPWKDRIDQWGKEREKETKGERERERENLLL